MQNTCVWLGFGATSSAAPAFGTAAPTAFGAAATTSAPSFGGKYPNENDISHLSSQTNMKLKQNLYNICWKN